MYRLSTKGIRSKRISIKVNGLRGPLLIMKPLNEPKNAPGVMWIHGGGYMTGAKEMAYVGRAAESFYCETLKYIDDLKAAGVDAEVDVYEGMYHAFDMSEPESNAGREAIKRFNEHFAYAKEHYFAEQEL